MRKFVVTTVLIICAWASPSSVSSPPAAGFFRVEARHGTSWFIDNADKEFFSIGIDVLTPADTGEPRGRRYSGLRTNGGDFQRWSDEVRA
ncbi:MAG TPA: hypothetical protein VKY31_05445, partial [Terriglobia bacterium]|nr:hypothetical protein [Terriglobia bacterium]